MRDINWHRIFRNSSVPVGSDDSHKVFSLRFPFASRIKGYAAPSIGYLEAPSMEAENGHIQICLLFIGKPKEKLDAKMLATTGRFRSGFKTPSPRSIERDFASN
jgi:hypothetical protein